MRSKYFMRGSSLAIACYDLWRVGFAETSTLCAREAHQYNGQRTGKRRCFHRFPRIDVSCRPNNDDWEWQTKSQQCCPDGQNRYDRASPLRIPRLADSPAAHVSVPKIRCCNNGDEVRRGRARYDAAQVLDGAMERSVFVERPMCPQLVVIGGILVRGGGGGGGQTLPERLMLQVTPLAWQTLSKEHEVRLLLHFPTPPASMFQYTGAAGTGYAVSLWQAPRRGAGRAGSHLREDMAMHS